MNDRIGIVGGGQLGRMLAQAAKKLGFHTTVLDPTPNGPAAQVADAEIVGDFKNAEAIRELAKQVNVMTFEIESANADALDELLAAGHDINPRPKHLRSLKTSISRRSFSKNILCRSPTRLTRIVAKRYSRQLRDLAIRSCLRRAATRMTDAGMRFIEDESQIDSGLEN